MMWRSGACRQLSFTSGTCPTSKNEIAISVKDSRLFDWQVGTRLHIAEITADPRTSEVVHRTLRVVAVYHVRHKHADYWFGSPPTGRSGSPHMIPGDRTSPGRGVTHDVWLTPASTFAGKGAWPGHVGPGTSWAGTSNEIDLPMAASRVGLDQLLGLAPRVHAYTTNRTNTMGSGWDTKPGVILSTGVGDLAESARNNRHQANSLVPLFLAQLTLLGSLALWMVLGAAMESRRPEIALARLRGLSPRRARRILLADVWPAVVVGAWAGVAGAGLLTLVAERTWLVAGTPFETRWPVPATAGLLLICLVGLAWVRARATSRADPAHLLRRVPPRRRGWTAGVGDVVAIVLAGTAFIVSATGALTGPVGMAAPTLLALCVGLLLAHLLGPAITGGGRALLRRGRIAGGLALLQAARRPSTRKVIVTVTVATALLVFAGDALLVGSRNRTARAEAETGAPVVTTVDGSDLATVQDVVHGADPTGRRVTTVAELTASTGQGTTTVAVSPAEFSRIGQFPGVSVDDIPWGRLKAPHPPIGLTGTSLSVRATSSSITAIGHHTEGDGSVAAVELRVVFVDSHARQREAELGDLPTTGSRRRVLKSPIPCAKGCQLVGLDFFAPGLHAPLRGTVTIDSMSVSGHPIDPGEASTWRNSTPAENGATKATAAPRRGLTVAFRQADTSDVTLTSRTVPTSIPALVSGRLPATAHGDDYRALGLDGLPQHMIKVGSLPYVPGSPPDSTLVDIATLQRLGVRPVSTIKIQVWYAHDDPALMKRIARGLKAEHITIQTTSTTREAELRYDRTATTWALQLGTVVGAAAAVVAALTLVIAVVTTWRLRCRDYAALRMSGLPTRRMAAMSVGEQLPVIVVSVLLGVVCGVVGARVALPEVPLFDTPPDLPIIDYRAAWVIVTLAGAGALAMLGAVGWLCARWVGSRATLTRLRESA